MSVLTERQLLEIMPKCSASVWLHPINAALAEFGLATPARRAMFLAQVAHESRECWRLEENLNYSAERLLAVFPSRFDPVSARRFEKRPDAIANVAYAGRMGNGDSASGDGWRYRGRGLLQITGRANYAACGEALKLDLLHTPLLLTQIGPAARSAAWFFAEHANLIRWADACDLEACTRRINGGLNGLPERQDFYERACGVLGV